MTCLHSYEIRTLEATFIKPAKEWLYLTGPFCRNENNERCVTYGNALYSIEGAIEEKTFVVCNTCGKVLL